MIQGMQVKKTNQLDQALADLESTPQQREFFRFDKGMLVEYDLTKSAGKNIKLTSEELEVINS